MKRFAPDPIAAEDLETALAPAIGGERKVYISETNVSEVGTIRQPAEDSGVLTLNQAFTLPALGQHLTLVVDRAGARSAAQMVVTLNVVLADNTVTTAVATFDVPSRSQVQKYSMPHGAAVDLLPQGSGNADKKIKTVSSHASTVGGDVNNRFAVLAMPDLETDFSFVGCTNQSNFKLPIGKSLPIPCGMNPTAYTKRGRGEPGTLNVTEKYSDYLLGLTRLNGFFATAVVEIWKDERVLTDRFVLVRWCPMASPEIGDGDDIATDSTEGNFERFAIFTAR